MYGGPQCLLCLPACRIERCMRHECASVWRSLSRSSTSMPRMESVREHAPERFVRFLAESLSSAPLGFVCVCSTDNTRCSKFAHRSVHMRVRCRRRRRCRRRCRRRRRRRFRGCGSVAILLATLPGFSCLLPVKWFASKRARTHGELCACILCCGFYAARLFRIASAFGEDA